MDTIAVVSMIIALVAAGTSVYFARRSEGLAEQSERNAYLERVRDWADTTIEITVAATRICRSGCPEEEFAKERDRLRTLLSAQIEKGRWFFPNVLQEHVGQRNEAAYRGLRQPILDALVSIYDALDSLEWAGRAQMREEIISFQRSFVSEVQLHLDPTSRDKTYKDLVARYEERARFVDES